MRRPALALLMLGALIPACTLTARDSAGAWYSPPDKSNAAGPPANAAPTLLHTPAAPAEPAPPGVDLFERKDGEMDTRSTRTPLDITILYDNNAFDERLKTAWGFSAYIRFGESTILFDTGGDGPTLMGNMEILSIDPASVEVVVLSHVHNDHVGGLDGFLEQASKPVVYLLPSFPKRFKEQVSEKTQIIEVAEGQSLASGVISTGEMGSEIPEQALILETGQGLVVITGCAHPGIVEIIEKAVQIEGQHVYLVMGGFHLREKTSSEVDAIIADFQRLGVEKVAPTHCTGNQAISRFRTAFGEDFIQAGVGRRFQITE